MKKIFSLAAVTGMFMLMSFSFGAEKLPSEELQDSCNDYSVDVVNILGLEGEDGYILYGILYDDCIEKG